MEVTSTTGVNRLETYITLSKCTNQCGCSREQSPSLSCVCAVQSDLKRGVESRVRQASGAQGRVLLHAVSQLGLLLCLLPALSHPKPSASVSFPCSLIAMYLSCLSLAVTLSRKPTLPSSGQVICASDVLCSALYCSRAVTPLCKYLPPNHNLCKDGVLSCS